MITLNYTRQNGNKNGLRSVQFVIDEQLGLDAMLYELTHFLRAMGYAIDSDEQLMVVLPDEIEALYAPVDAEEIETILKDLTDDDKE
tara:strand:- start:303 stop:563 length:261 start_codon:yes stop_codon:yes gene_type:complete